MPDSVATTQTFDRTGNIGADYPGHVHARAFDLDLPVNGQVIADENRIQWKRVFDGIGRGGLYATQLAGDTATILNTYAQSPLNGSHQANLIVHADDAGGANNRVDVQADTQQRTLLDSRGGSDYLRPEGFVTSDFTGQIASSTWPGPGNGTPFVATSSTALVFNFGSCYTPVAGGTPIVQVYVSGTYMGDMTLAGILANNRVTLVPLVFTVNTVPGTTYWVWHRITAGTSVADDRIRVAVIQ